MKTLRRVIKQDKEHFSVPRGVQDVIPIRRIWEDGIFEVGMTNKKAGLFRRLLLWIMGLLGIKSDDSTCYGETFRFEDINYSVASNEDKEEVASRINVGEK